MTTLVAALLIQTAVLAAAPPVVPGPGEVDHEPTTAAIYGGEPVAPGDWPAVVAVQTTKLCTGTLVAPDLVLTAAHCFDSGAVDSVEISFGDALAGATVVPAADWGTHPDFCLPSECGEDIHDFAWVRLPAPIANVTPIPVITDQDELDEVLVIGTPLTFVGFGQTEVGGLGTKREVDAAITMLSASGREFQAGGDGKDTCLGDSGGPSLVQLDSGEWRVAGVISRGGECGGGGVYGVPFPELCWLRDSSGVDLLPESCSECDCVSLPVENETSSNCELGSLSSAAGRGGLLAELLALFGLGLLVHRRRRRRQRLELR